MASRSSLMRPGPIQESERPAPDPPAVRPDTTHPSPTHVALALTSLAAAAIHFAVVGDHFDEALVVGSFFVIVAWAQAAWALAILLVPVRWLLVGGAAGNLAVVAVWAASRTTGLPVGPDPWTTESVGVADALATALEIAIAGGCALLITGRRRTVEPRHRSRGPVIAYGLALAVLASGAIVAGGDHSHAEVAAGHRHGAGSHAEALSAERSGPPHTHSADGHEAGTPDLPQLDQIEAAMAKYEDVAVARAEGYERMDGDYPETGAHFGKPEWTEGGAFSSTGDLDLAQPEYLMYTKRLTGDWKLVAVAYVVDMWEYPEPPTSLVGAPYHEHVWNCIEPEGWTLDEEEYGYVTREACEDMGNTWSPGGEWMTHVWLIPNPMGVFADWNPTVT